MNTLPPDTDPFAFDDHVRAVYDPGTEPLSPAALRVWQHVQPRLGLPGGPPPPPMGASRLVLASLGSFVLGLLLMWLQQPVAVPAQPASPAPASARLDTSRNRSGTVPARLDASRSRSGTVRARLDAFRSRSGTVSALLQPASGRSIALASISGSVSGLGAPTVPAVLAGLVLTETTFAAIPSDSARPFRERRRAALLAQRAELTRLRWRTDSLLLGLGVGTTEPGVPVADTTSPPHLLTTSSRWSVALAFAPERNFFGLTAPAGDSLSALRRTHEQGRAGYNASILAEYRLDHRLSVGAGIGVASVGAELRLTDVRTTVSTHFDTARTARTETVRTRAYAINSVRDSIRAPIVNFNNEIIGYQYLPTTRRDTVWTNLVNTEMVYTTTVTPTVTTRQERTARVLRPNYRFLTVPLLVRYRLGGRRPEGRATAAERWWADVALGAQVQFFLGGTQATTADGRTYRTERVGPNGGPFRPMNVALTGAVAFNYALTPRLSASVAPALRYQLESVYKTSTNLTQRPTATGVQLGLKLAF